MKTIFLSIVLIIVFALGLMIGEGLPWQVISTHPCYSDDGRHGILWYSKPVVLPAIRTFSYDADKLRFVVPIALPMKRTSFGIDNWEDFCPLKHEETK